MLKKTNHNYVFVDESGDPGKPYKIDEKGEKIPTGASKFYIISVVAVTSDELFKFEDKICEIKKEFHFKPEIKSITIPLLMYKKLLNVFNELNIKIFYRAVNKETYKGTFAVDGKKKLHNIFDEYNLMKTVKFAIADNKIMNVEVVIDRAERRILDGKFDNFNDYLFRRINTKTITKIKYVTHVNSEYVFLMQMSDLVSGAIKECYSKQNKELKSVVDKNLLRKIW